MTTVPKRRRPFGPVERNAHLQRKFGISLEQYDEMLDQQGGVCAICADTCPTGRNLAVDHDHRTGTVRGLLCHACNTALGKMNDSPTQLRRAADYLDAYGVPEA